MELKEARAWLQGLRSTTNIVPQEPFETWMERVARTDAAMYEIAYWTCKAHADCLIKEL
jgi:hypothetical protein